MEKASLLRPSMIAAEVMLRMRQTLGDGAELARSVVNDMLRKSLVTNSSTISTGVMIGMASYGEARLPETGRSRSS